MLQRTSSHRSQTGQHLVDAREQDCGHSHGDPEEVGGNLQGAERVGLVPRER